MCIRDSARAAAGRAVGGAAQEVAALMHRFDKSGDGSISFDSFCEAVIPKDFTFGSTGAPARPVTAPPRHELGTGALLRTYARVELDAADGKAVDALLARLRTAFADRGSRLAVIFREMDTSRSGARSFSVRPTWCGRGATLGTADATCCAAPVRARRTGSLGPAEFRATLERHNIRVSEKEFALLMRALKKHSARSDDRIEYATFGAMLGRQ